MANYVANTFQAQTPIGQAMQSFAQNMFQARLMKQQQDLKQQEMAMKQAEFDAKMPLFEAQTAAANAGAAAHYATADEKAAEIAAMKARPDTVASAFANLTRPQLGQVRGFQQSGSWGEAPKIAGLDNLGSGGDWMPTFANPQTMQKVNQADVLTGMASGPQQADNIAKAITQMMLNSQMGSGDMQGLNAASAALKGKLRGDPNAQGLYQNQDVGGGVVGNDMQNPLVADEVNRGKAYSAHQYAGANQANAAAALNQANAKAVPQKTAIEQAKADAYVGGQKAYQKGIVKDQMSSVIGLVDTTFGISRAKDGSVTKGTPPSSELYNTVMRDLEANGQPVSATSVAQALQRISQSNPSLVSEMPETGWFGGDSTPQLRPQLAQPAGKMPAAAQKPAAASKKPRGTVNVTDW